MHEVGILGPKDGQPSGSGRAVCISMEGNLWKTPGEELEPERLGRMVSSDAGQSEQNRGEQRAMERALLSVSEGEAKVMRAACLWHTCSRMSPEDPMRKHQDHGGPAGKANDLRPVSCELRDRAAALR
jgi:hypothetical protein